MARRYLFSPKSHSVINLISWVAGIAVAVPTAALILILSLHNGLTHVLSGMFNTFDPPLRITVAEGKYFAPDMVAISDMAGVGSLSYTLEEIVLIRKGDREQIGVMRGVDSNYEHTVGIKNLVTYGEYSIGQGDHFEAVVGQGIAYNLGISVSLPEPIELYSIRPETVRTVIPGPIYHTSTIYPSGIYALDQDTDGQVIFVPLEFASALSGHQGLVSSVEVRPSLGVKASDLQVELKARLGTDFKVQTRYEQKESLYKAVNQEKIVIYALMMMILLIASMSLSGSIVTLISDKRGNISTLRSLGADDRLVRHIFLHEGMLIVAIGSTFGILVGTILSLIQQQYGIVKMAGENMLVDSYPVRVMFTDVVWIGLGVVILGFAICQFTVRSVLKSDKRG